MFLTCGTEGCIKLWDLRACRPVRRFAGARCCSFDPQMRYMACGARDARNCVKIYDIRSGDAMENLVCGADAVCDVDFSPRHPQLAVASQDGRVRFFRTD